MKQCQIKSRPHHIEKRITQLNFKASLSKLPYYIIAALHWVIGSFALIKGLDLAVVHAAGSGWFQVDFGPY